MLQGRDHAVRSHGDLDQGECLHPRTHAGPRTHLQTCGRINTFAARAIDERWAEGICAQAEIGDQESGL